MVLQDLCGLDDWKNVPGLGRTAGESLNMQLYQQGVGKSNITILRRYFQTDEENLWQSWRMVRCDFIEEIASLIQGF